ncbi:MAG TPA: FprA family A-type flavoprotein [bacterium]|nr:FprA family A-type flavoprotein [bacterium]
MPAVEMKPDIYWVGVNDRTTDLFEGLWPVADTGVSYNTYLINDEKKVIIDLVKAIKTDAFFDQIHAVMPLSEIDYVIINHMEPDHTGVLKTLHKIAPDITLVGTEKMKQMLAHYYGITDPVRVVRDGETLTLGRKTLQFFEAPFIHWPETMVTWEQTQKVLFPCDAFGSYGALRGTIFDDECLEPEFYIREALRYYVNIVARFSQPVLKAIEKLSGLDIQMIAPSHGLIWRKDPARIIDYYRNWAELAQGGGDKGITLLYGSMYGNTEAVMDAIAQGLACSGITIEIFDVARIHTSYILPALWIHKGVMVGAPTYEGRLFPPMAQALDMAVLKKIQNKKAAYFGSYGWSGGALRQVKSMMEPMQWDFRNIFEFQGGIEGDVLKKAEAFGREFSSDVQSE